MEQIKPITTRAQAEDVLKYLEYGRQNGYELEVTTKAYVLMLDNVIRHVKIRLARGLWT